MVAFTLSGAAATLSLTVQLVVKTEFSRREAGQSARNDRGRDGCNRPGPLMRPACPRDAERISAVTLNLNGPGENYPYEGSGCTPAVSIPGYVTVVVVLVLLVLLAHGYPWPIG